MARRDSMADVMQALGIISQAASNIHAADVAGRMRTLELDIAQESRLKEVELQGTISEYYDLKKERADISATLQDEYPRLNEKFITDNFHTVKSTFEGVAQDDMSNLRSNMDILIDDIAGLESLDRQLSEQKSYYKGQEQAIAGITTLVDPGEFESFVEEYQEKFPGKPTAGLYAAYDAGTVTTYQRRQAATDMQAVSKASAQSNWQGMREMASSEDFEVSAYTDNEVLQADIAKMISHENYQDVVKYMNADTTGKVKDIFYEMFPSLMWSMEGHVESIDAIESEFLGRTKETHVENITNNFLSNLSNTKSNKEAFVLYDQEQAKLTNKADKKAMFAAMEKQLGKGDLYEGKGGYKEHLDKTSKFDPEKPISVSLMAPALEKYKGTEREQAEQIYEVLNTIEDSEAIESLKELTLNISAEQAIETEAGGFYQRPLYTAGKAFGGGLFGVDSPYYDAFYDSMDDQMANIVAEEDPFGPDFIYYGFHEEHIVPELMRERYGDDIYNEAIRIADQIGREAQIKELETVLKSGTGEDYFDLVRILNSSVLKEYRGI